MNHTKIQLVNYEFPIIDNYLIQVKFAHKK